MCITLFCTLRSRCRTTAGWNFPISRAHFYVSTTQNVLFPFLNLETVLSDLTPENFAKFDEFNEIEWDRWSLKEREFTF